MSWETAWEGREIPWDAGAAAPELVRLVDEGRLPAGRALVPGCGSGYDVLVLASEERTAIGIDLAPGAEQRFRELRRDRGVSPERARFETVDFFEYEPAERFDLIWDYTFLCAIEPKRREDWAKRTFELLGPGGTLATLLFPVVRPGTPPVAADGSGPPYRLTPDLAAALLGETFERVELRPARESHPDREGKEWVGIWRKPE